MKNFISATAAFVCSIVEKAKEHSAGLLLSANCAVWFACGFFFEKLFS